MPDRWWPSRVDVLIAVGLLLLTGPVIQRWTAQPASRYLATVAIVDDGTFRLDSYAHLLGEDFAAHRGHVYTDKAPYQPIAAGPIYAAYRLVGGEPFPVARDVVRLDDLDRGAHRGLWWVSLWSSTLPAVALTLLMRRSLVRSHPEIATPVALALAVGTIMLPFASQLFGHVLTALWVAIAFHLLDDPALSWRRSVVAGGALGLAVGTEYPAALLAVIAGAAVLLRHPANRTLALAGGAAVTTLPLLAYNAAVFGGPLELSYRGHQPVFGDEGAFGVPNLVAPTRDHILEALVGGKGLLTLTPIMLLAVAGCVVSLHRRLPAGRESAVALAGLAGLVLVSTGMDGIGAASPGPRYLVPVLPLFARPLATMWRMAPVLCAGAATVGATCMILATITDPIGPILRDWVERSTSGDLAANVFTGHAATWPLYLTTILGIGVLLAAVRSDPLRAAGATEHGVPSHPPAVVTG